MQLSPRLQTIFDFIEPGFHVTDVGTDHGFIPIALIESGKCARVTATDLRVIPLSHAKHEAEIRSVASKIHFICCDGLQAVSEDMADIIVISGLGGETIRSILEKTPWSANKTLILQPQSKLPELRAFLIESGQQIVDAALTSDNGIIYVVWLVKPGTNQAMEWVDAPLIRKNDPLLPDYLQLLIRKSERIISGLSRSGNDQEESISREEDALAYYRLLLQQIMNNGTMNHHER